MSELVPSPPSRPARLTARQRAFVDEYLIDLNAAQAAMRAGYSATCAKNYGWTLLDTPAIRAAVEAGMAERSARTEVASDRVVRELARVGFSDLRRVFTPDGMLKCVTTLDDDTGAALASVKVVTRRRPGCGHPVEVEYVTEIKLWDKSSALEKLGKHLGMFRERIDLEVGSDLATMIAEGRQRVAARGD